MKMKNILLISTLWLSSFLLNAQESKSVKNYELGIDYGFFSFWNTSLNHKWSELEFDFAEPDTSYDYKHYSYLTSSKAVNLSFSISPKTNERKITPVFRFSYQYSNGLYSSENWSKTQEYAYDTLTSSSNGKQYYIDSNATQSIRRSYTSNLHQLSAGVLFQRTIKNRFAFYSGLDIGIGITSGNKVSFYQYESYAFTGYPPAYSYQGSKSYFYYPSNNYQYSEKRLPALASVNGNIPVGVRYTLGKKDNFLARTTLSYEISVGTNLFFNSQLGVIKQFYIKNFVGLRYSF